MRTKRRFSAAVLEAIRNGKYLWIRAGDEHRFIAIWAVVVGSRVFVRSWNAKLQGWHQAFLDEKRGALRPGKDAPAVAVRATADVHHGEPRLTNEIADRTREDLNLVVHNTSWLPAHFHQTVAGAVFLAFLGGSLLLVSETRPYFSSRRASTKPAGQ